MKIEKKDFLHNPVRHIDITGFDSNPIIEQFADACFQAGNLAKAAEIYSLMLEDPDCSVILCLAGSIFSAGCKKTIYDLVSENLVDVIVSTGALIVDQDFFEALGHRHYQLAHRPEDELLQNFHLDRIYDHLIDEEDLRDCDMTISRIADGLQPGAYSSREFIAAMGEYLQENGREPRHSVLYECHRREVPVFVPAFSDCSAGFGLVHHQHKSKGPAVSIDSVKDFLELTRIKCEAGNTGLVMIGGGVPKNFAQDVTVAAEILGYQVPMHKYAIQITVADERDGALSGSTLKEARSWGKVDSGHEQMVFCEATIALPLLASSVYHRHKGRRGAGRLQRVFNSTNR